MVQYLRRTLVIYTHMAYTKNPHMPKVRQEAADMVRRGHTPTQVGRRFGVSSSTVCKWVKKAQKIGYHPIPTESSRPRSHPKQLSVEVVRKIVSKRLEIKRCSEVIHKELLNDGIEISLSSVKRTLARRYLLKKRSPWKRYHPPVKRPCIEKPGDLVEIDTIHIMVGEKKRIYVYTLIDVYSRFVYAKAYTRISGVASVDFLMHAQQSASFNFNMIQSDHGPEFGKWFVSRVKKKHRYTRVGKPNDNAHIERFNRTIQEECLDTLLNKVPVLNKALEEYIPYYNTRRLHLGINLQTPIQLLSVQGID